MLECPIILSCYLIWLLAPFPEIKAFSLLWRNRKRSTRLSKYRKLCYQERQRNRVSPDGLPFWLTQWPHKPDENQSVENWAMEHLYPTKIHTTYISSIWWFKRALEKHANVECWNVLVKMTTWNKTNQNLLFHRILVGHILFCFSFYFWGYWRWVGGGAGSAFDKNIISLARTY